METKDTDFVDIYSRFVVTVTRANLWSGIVVSIILVLVACYLVESTKDFITPEHISLLPLLFCFGVALFFLVVSLFLFKKTRKIKLDYLHKKQSRQKAEQLIKRIYEKKEGLLIVLKTDERVDIIRVSSPKIDEIDAITGVDVKVAEFNCRSHRQYVADEIARIKDSNQEGEDRIAYFESMIY